MKLLQKSSGTYFLVSGTAFIVAGAVIYLTFSYVLENQLNEKLAADLQNVEHTISKNGSLPNYYPFIESKEIKGNKVSSDVIADTMIFDLAEKELVPYRQISEKVTINGKLFFIVVRDTLIESSDLLVTIVIVIASVFIILLLCLYFINRKLSLNIWKPFYKTLDELKEFSYDKPDFRLSSDSTLEEFRELKISLEKLTQKVIIDYQTLKRFTEDASHEIQTPLSIIQSKLEILLQFQGLDKEMADLINSIYINTLRISRLTKTLLLLTKISNDQFPERIAVDLSLLLSEKIEYFEEQFKGKTLMIVKEICPDCIKVTNLYLAESLFMNLLSNVLKHSTSGSVVSLKLDRSVFEISNHGRPLSVLPSKLFDRFFKIEKSSDSHGLGLPIVKEICKLNRWEVIYENVDTLHKVTIKF